MVQSGTLTIFKRLLTAAFKNGAAAASCDVPLVKRVTRTGTVPPTKTSLVGFRSRVGVQSLPVPSSAPQWHQVWR